jgi:hypothetical protein
MKYLSPLACSLLLGASATDATELPDGYWPADRTQPILDARRRITLAPDLGQLSPAELQAVDALIEAGRIMHTLYEQQLHEEALDARQRLEDLLSTTCQKDRSLRRSTMNGSPSCPSVPRIQGRTSTLPA